MSHQEYRAIKCLFACLFVVGHTACGKGWHYDFTLGLDGMKLQDRVPSKGLRERRGLDDKISVLHQNRLR